MTNRCKIEHYRYGINYTPKYAGNIPGALRMARSLGWWNPDPTNPAINWDMRPRKAHIYERTNSPGDRSPGWELVAIVTEDSITTEDHQSRLLYKRADAAMAKARVHMESTYATMTAFNKMTDQEYGES